MNQPASPRIGILGAGAWGTALAQMLAREGQDVIIWAREPELVEEINAHHRNSLYLPQAALSPSLRATGDLAALANADILLAVVPAQHMQSVLGKLASSPRDLVLCSKGIEASSGKLMHQLAAEILPDAGLAVLSGPTFAHEVAQGLPTAVTLACGEGRGQWERLAPAIARPHFRPYYSDDLVGAEIGGAVKNVLAIACGLVDGLQLGLNARAALIARGYAEMERFGEAMGARRETLAGLCGLGDLVLTCTSTASRNFSFGKALGEGESAARLLTDRRSVAEGAHTAPVLQSLARSRHVAMPIVEAVNAIIEGADPARIVEQLLSRPLRGEQDEPR